MYLLPSSNRNRDKVSFFLLATEIVASAGILRIIRFSRIAANYHQLCEVHNRRFSKFINSQINKMLGLSLNQGYIFRCIVLASGLARTGAGISLNGIIWYILNITKVHFMPSEFVSVF